MSPRPRKASDQVVFAAVTAVIGRRGPAEWTLGDVAAEAGVTASALVQRFGSKRALLLAVSGELTEQTASLFAELRQAHASPLSVVRAYGDCMAKLASSPGALAHHLTYLQQDLQDEELHAQVRRQAKETRRQLRRLLAEAVEAGELRRNCDVAVLARRVEVVVNGAVLTWALHAEGTAAGCIRGHLRALVGPELASARSSLPVTEGRRIGPRSATR